MHLAEGLVALPTLASSPSLPGSLGQLRIDMEVCTTWVYMRTTIHHKPCHFFVRESSLSRVMRSLKVVIEKK